MDSTTSGIVKLTISNKSWTSFAEKCVRRREECQTQRRGWLTSLNFFQMAEERECPGEKTRLTDNTVETYREPLVSLNMAVARKVYRRGSERRTKQDAANEYLP